MNPDERFVAALRGEPVDYAPCVPVFWRGTPRHHAFPWASDEERLRVAIEELGVDATLPFGLAGRAPEVRSWLEQPPGEPYPVLHNAIDTPRGPLTAAVRKSEDYPHGDRIPFFSDWACSRYAKPWIETEADVERLATVYLPASSAQLEAARASLERRRGMARAWRVPIVAGGFFALNGAVHLMGAERAALASMDCPEVIAGLVELFHRVQRQHLDVLLSWGCTTVLRNGWYDSTDFWSPAQFQRWIVPHLRDDIAAVHAAGGAFIYQMCTGVGPLLPALAGLEFDCLLEAEPVLGGVSLRELAAALPGKSFWGGVSAPIHIGEGTPEGARAAVRGAFEALAGRGFLLKAVPSIRAHWPWENVLAMIDEWKALR